MRAADGPLPVSTMEYQLKPGQSGRLGLAWQPMTLPRRTEAERPPGQWNEGRDPLRRGRN